jgi:hypothetical protein
VKNKHGTKGGSGIPFWSGKDTMNRPAADMERIGKKGSLSVLFWQPLQAISALIGNIE